MIENIDVKLRLKILAVQVASFQLQDQLAYQLLVLGRTEGTVQRQLACFERAAVVFPLRLVLVVHARDMSEAGDAGGEQIAAAPTGCHDS